MLKQSLLRGRRALLIVAILSPLPTLAGPMILQSLDRQTYLLELYTSEGCSSCPPADRWLSDLGTDRSPSTRYPRLGPSS